MGWAMDKTMTKELVISAYIESNPFTIFLNESLFIKQREEAKKAQFEYIEFFYKYKRIHSNA